MFLKKKAIHIDFPGKEAISFMCGDNLIIVLNASYAVEGHNSSTIC